MNLKFILELEIFSIPAAVDGSLLHSLLLIFQAIGFLGVFFVAYLAHKEKIFLHPWGLPTNVFMESIFSPSWKLLESLWRGLREKADGWKGCVSLCLGLNS